MTLTMQILKILAKSKEGLSAKTFAEMTGAPIEKVVRVTQDCIRQRWLIRRDGFYEITLEGAVRSKFVPKTPAKKLAQKSLSDAAKRAVRRLPPAGPIVATAIANQHPLALAWRAA